MSKDNSRASSEADDSNGPVETEKSMGDDESVEVQEPEQKRSLKDPVPLFCIFSLVLLAGLYALSLGVRHYPVDNETSAYQHVQGFVWNALQRSGQSSDADEAVAQNILDCSKDTALVHKIYMDENIGGNRFLKEHYAVFGVPDDHAYVIARLLIDECADSVLESTDRQEKARDTVNVIKDKL